MINHEDLPDKLKQTDFTMPSAYFTVFERQLTSLAPWAFIDAQEAQSLFEVIQELYPHIPGMPFARRRDNDDVAVIIAQNTTDYTQGTILIVHLFASKEFAVDDTFPEFWDWFRIAVNEMIAFTSSR